MHTVLQCGAYSGECHAGAGQLALISKVTWRDPDAGQFAEMLQGGKAFCIQLVGLMDIAHHDFGFAGMGQEGHTLGGLDLVDDPIPVADALEGDGSSGRELGEERADRPRLMVDSHLFDEPSVMIEHGEDRISLVCVASDLIMGLPVHAAPPLRKVSLVTTSVAGGAALSYNHSTDRVKSRDGSVEFRD